ncbi:MAG: hypothetical protein A2W37_14820 [Chloroflexi bacterium RBG_16_63_12]|nr:MAG: hypothetical protein A2W37_14820 [Chloroflexi bacterium RBG_16_63_12]
MLADRAPAGLVPVRRLDYRPRRDGVDADARRERFGKHLGKHDEACLADRMDGILGPRLQCAQVGDVDDGPAAPRQHRTRGSLRAKERGGEINRHRPLPVFRRQCEDIAALHNRCGVDQEVHAPELGLGGLKEMVNALRGRQISADGDGLCALLLYLLNRRVGCGFRLMVVYDDVRPGPGQL